MKGKIAQLFRTGFFHIYGGNVINKALAFFNNVILVRVLTKREYGIFTYTWNIYGMVMLFSGLGIAGGMLQICSEKKKDKFYSHVVMSYSVRYGMICNLILGGVILLTAQFAPLTMHGARPLLYMLPLLPATQLLYELMSVYLRVQRRNQEYVRLSVINTMLTMAFSVCFAWQFKEKALVMGYYAAYFFAALYGIFILRIPVWGVSVNLERQERRDMMKISIISVFNHGLSQLLYLLDVFVIGIVVADEMVLGSYKVGVTIPSAMTFIPLSLIIYIYPYFAEKREERLWCLRNYKRVIIYFGAANMCLSVGLVLFAPWILPLVFGMQYTDSVLIFRVLAVNYFFSATFRVVSGNLLVTQRKLKFNLFVAVISGMLNVVADVVLISIYGAMGAAIATVMVTLLSGTLSTAYLLYIFQHS